MKTLVKLRYYKFGDLFLFQKSGIPIWGPVSGAVLEAVLACEEHNSDRFRWPKKARRLRLKGGREQWLTMLRYVDDVLVISFWFCPACIEKLINEIYRDTVKFDKSNDGESRIDEFNILKFLDLWLFVSCQTTNIFLVNKNDLYAASGIENLKGKNRFPIPDGPKNEVCKRLVSDFKSRLARFKQIKTGRHISLPLARFW